MTDPDETARTVQERRSAAGTGAGGATTDHLGTLNDSTPASSAYPNP